VRSVYDVSDPIWQERGCGRAAAGAAWSERSNRLVPGQLALRADALRQEARASEAAGLLTVRPQAQWMKEISRAGEPASACRQRRSGKGRIGKG